MNTRTVRAILSISLALIAVYGMLNGANHMGWLIFGSILVASGS